MESLLSCKQVQVGRGFARKRRGHREFREEGMRSASRNAYGCQREYGIESSIGHFESVSD